MAVNTEAGLLSDVTANDLITRAYRILGDTAYGETLTAAQADIGLEALNSMLESFSIERLMIYEVRQEALTWPANTTSRTIGSGADFDTHRPDRIEMGTYFQDANAISYPVDVLQNRAVYDAISDKTVTSSYPDKLLFIPSVTWGTLYVYPVPNQALTLYLNTWQPLQVFNTLTEVHAMPAGYRRMVAFNLAKELESETGLPLPMGALKIANESRMAIKRNNSVPTCSSTETIYALAGGKRADIVAGQ